MFRCSVSLFSLPFYLSLSLLVWLGKMKRWLLVLYCPFILSQVSIEKVCYVGMEGKQPRRPRANCLTVLRRKSAKFWLQPVKYRPNLEKKRALLSISKNHINLNPYRIKILSYINYKSSCCPQTCVFLTSLTSCHSMSMYLVSQNVPQICTASVKYAANLSRRSTDLR